MKLLNDEEMKDFYNKFPEQIDCDTEKKYGHSMKFYACLAFSYIAMLCHKLRIMPTVEEIQNAIILQIDIDKTVEQNNSTNCLVVLPAKFIENVARYFLGLLNPSHALLKQNRIFDLQEQARCSYEDYLNQVIKGTDYFVVRFKTVTGFHYQLVKPVVAPGEAPTYKVIYDSWPALQHGKDIVQIRPWNIEFYLEVF